MTVARSLTAAIWLLVAPPAAAAASPPAGEPAVFHAPLASDTFVRRVVEEAERLALERERRKLTWFDPATGLQWTRTDNGSDVSWHGAGRFCSELEAGRFPDWRLPTIEELETLHDRKASKRFNTPDAVRLSACCPWSSTKKTDSSAWNFNFHYRRRFSGSLTYTFDLRALCVRFPAEGEVPPEEEDEPPRRRRR